MWGLGQLEPDKQRDERLAKQLPFTDTDHEIRAQAAKLAGTRKLKTNASRLVDLRHDKNARVRFHAAMALGQAGNADTVPHLIPNDISVLFYREFAFLLFKRSESSKFKKQC